MLDASVDDEIITSFIFVEMTKINKLPWSKQFIERGVFFLIDSAVLGLNHTLYL